MMLAIGTADSNLHNADVKIWNLSDQHEIASWTGPTGPALSLVFSPDNKSLGCGKYDQTISVFDVESRQLRHSIIGHEGYVFSAAFAPDNKSIATGSADGPVKLWSTTAKQQCDFFEEPESGGYSLALNRSGDILATSGHHSVMLWDVASGQMLAALEGYDHLHSGIYVLFNPRGDLLATAAEGGVVRLWDVKSLKPVARWQAHDAQIRTMAFSPDGRTLATASRDETVVKLWDVESKKRRATLTHEGGIRSLAFSPDGRELASACKPKGSESSVVNIWNLSTLQINKSLPASQTGLSWVAWAPNGDVFAMGNGDRRVKLLQTGTWRELRQFKAHTNLIMQGEFSSDGKTLATASWDGTAKLWHVATGEQLLSFQTTGPCGALALSNDNKLVVTGVQTGTHEAIALWRAARTDETTHSGNATTRRQTSK
jgi:WD40 repeat protein